MRLREKIGTALVQLGCKLLGLDLDKLEKLAEHEEDFTVARVELSPKAREMVAKGLEQQPKPKEEPERPLAGSLQARRQAPVVR